MKNRETQPRTTSRKRQRLIAAAIIAALPLSVTAVIYSGGATIGPAHAAAMAAVFLPAGYAPFRYSIPSRLWVSQEESSTAESVGVTTASIVTANVLTTAVAVTLIAVKIAVMVAGG